MSDKNFFEVSEITSYIKHKLDTDFTLKNIVIKGEVASATYKGHVYFSLKDKNSQISAIMYANNVASGLDFELKKGDLVYVTGSISVYPAQGRYQVYATKIEKEGQGDQLKYRQELIKRLSEMGMFDEMYKKPIPEYPTRIGVVTSDSGKAFRDIVNNAIPRNPHIHIFLYPSLVQGARAAATIVSGIQYLDQCGMDVIIVGRGGGADDDLTAFDDENLARAIFDCQTPIISAVGHDANQSVADMVADRHVSTPTAAGVLASFDLKQLQEDLASEEEELYNTMMIKLNMIKFQNKDLYNRLQLHSPQYTLEKQKQLSQDLQRRLIDNLNRQREFSKHRLSLLASRLDGLSPIKKFASGYSYAMDESGKNISKVEDVILGDQLTLYVTDGHIKTQVLETTREELWQN